MTNFLKYGDKVIIQSTYNKKNQEVRGFLAAEGFFNDKLIFEELTPKKNGHKNIRENIFELVPVLNYEFHHEYIRTLKFREKITKIQQNILNSEKIQQKNVNDVLTDLKHKLNKLQLKMDNEREQNIKLIEQNRGSYIRYENSFLLMHSASKSFLTIKRICSNTTAIGYIIEMNKIYSQDMIMKILPRYKSFQQGDYIQYNDEVKIQSYTTEFYLAINYNDIIQEINEMNFQMQNVRMMNLANLTQINKKDKFGMFFNHTSKNGWKFLHFNDPSILSMKQVSFMWYDMFCLANLEHGSYLTIRQNMNDEDTLILIDENFNDFKENFVEFVWQFDSCNIDLAQLSETDRIIIKNFVLKNVFTDRIITLDNNNEIRVIKNQSEEGESNVILNVDLVQNENKLVASFEKRDYTQISKELTLIESNKNYFIYFVNEDKEKIFMMVKNKNLKVEKQDSEQELEQDDQVSQNSLKDQSDSQLFQVQNVLQSTINPEYDDAFCFQKILQEDQEWILFSLSLVKVLNGFLLTRNLENFLYKINVHIVEMIMFIFDDYQLQKLNFPMIESYKKAIPNQKKQTILREMKIFEILIKILDKLNTDQMILERKKNNEQDDDMSSFNIIYQVFTDCKNKVFYSFLYLIKNHARNQEYLSKWVEEFINQFFEIQGKVIQQNFNYQNLIKKIFKNNQHLLRKRLTTKKIQGKLTKIKQMKHRFEKFIEVLKFLLVVFNENKIDKQKCVFDLLFIENRQFVLQIKQDDTIDDHFIESPFPSSFQDTKIYLKNYNHLFEEEFHFMEYFDVLVKYAKEKNIKITKKLQEIHNNNYELFLNLIQKHGIEHNFKIIFLKTILYVYLKVPPNENITYSFYIKNYKNILEMKRKQFYFETKSSSSYQALVKFIYDSLQFQNDKIYEIQDDGEKTLSKYPDKIFKIIIVLLNYGFLRHTEDIKQILNVFFQMLEQQNITSLTLLLFLNDFLPFIRNYNFNLILQKIDNDKVQINLTDLNFFSNFNIALPSLNHTIIDNCLQMISKNIYSNEIPVFKYFSENFFKKIIHNFCKQKENQNKKSYEFQKECLTTLRNIFYYKKDFVYQFLNTKVLNDEENIIYEKLYAFKLRFKEILHNQKSIQYNESPLKALINQLMANFIQNQTFLDLNEFYSKQAYKIIYNNFQLKEKNIYLYFHLSQFQIISNFQKIAGKIELLDVIFQIIEDGELQTPRYGSILQQLYWLIFIICKDQEENCYYVWRKYKKLLYQNFQYPCVSLLMLFSILIKNNTKILSDDQEIKEFLEQLFSPNVTAYSKNSRNLITTYFILVSLENIVLYKNKIIFKNQVLVGRYLKQLQNLNENIKKFLNTPNIIKWEFHEIDFQNEKITILNPEISIYCKVLELLSLLAKGSYNVSDNLIRNMFSLKNLMEVLCNAYPLSLKISVLKFFINSYFFVDKSKIFPIINEIIITLNEEFFKQMHQIIDKTKEQVSQQKHLFLSCNYNGPMDDFATEYLSVNLAFFIILLVKINKKYGTIMSIINQKITIPLKKFVIDQLDDISFSSHQIQKKKKIIEILLPKTNDQFQDLNLNSNNKYQLKDNLLIEQNKDEIIEIVQEFIFYGVQINQNELYKDEIPEFLKISSSIIEFFKNIYIHKSKQNSQFVKKVLLEKEEVQFNELYRHIFHNKNIESDKRNFLLNLNKYMYTNFFKLEKSEKLFCLLLIKKYLETLNTKENIPIAEWSEENILSFDQNRSFIIKQNFVASQGTIETILLYIEHTTDVEILTEIIGIANAILLGGNNDSQNLFYYKITENTNFNFIQQINNLIQDLFGEIIQSSKISNKQEKHQIDQIHNQSNKNVDLTSEIFDEELLYENKIEKKRIKKLFILLRYIFRFLQLLSEGQFKKFQDYLSNQNKSDKNINIILTTSVQLKDFLEFNFIYDYELRNAILDFLIEIIQGPHVENQKMIFKFKIVEMCKSYIYELNLNEKIYESSYQKMYGQYYNKSVKKIIKLFYSMLESNLKNNLIESMKNNMDKNFFKEKLKIELSEYLENNNITPKGQINYQEVLRKHQILKFNEDIQDTFDYYFLSQKLGIQLQQSPDEEEKLNYLKFFTQYSAHIEIKMGSELKTVYFIVHPICENLNVEMKEDILTLIEKKDQNERINYLFENLTTIYLKIENEARQRNNKLITFLKLIPIRSVFLIVVILLNFYILIFMDSSVSDSTLEPNQYSFNSGKFILTITTMILLFICILKLLLFTILEFKILFLGFWRKKLIQYAQQIDKNSLNKSQKRILAKYNETQLSSKEIQDIIGLYINQQTGHKTYSFYLQIYYYFHGFSQFLLNSKFLILLSYIFFCIFGIYFDLFFFYSLLLIEIALQNPSMTTVFKAISINKNQFVLLIIFELCIVIIFANFAYYFVSETFWNSSIDNGIGENMCVSIWQCVLSIFSLGPRSSGSIGDVLERQTFEESNRSTFYFRYSFDLLCFIIINVIFMNVIFGIIIDTFKVLRSRNNEIQQQKSNLCYVCYLTRTEFDKEQQDFEEHVSNTHNLWNYIFFVIYLNNKFSTEYSGIEAEISKKLEMKDINWVPFMATQRISGKNFELINEIKNLEKKIMEIQNHMNNQQIIINFLIFQNQRDVKIRIE